MNIHTAYTIYNNGIQSVEPQLAEAIDRIIDDKNKQLEKLYQVELAEVKACIEIKAGEGYLTALLKKRIHQNYDLQDENENLRGALQEYAAKENYERVANEPDICEAGYSHPTWEPSWIELDNGETARKALAGESK